MCPAFGSYKETYRQSHTSFYVDIHFLFSGTVVGSDCWGHRDECMFSALRGLRTSFCVVAVPSYSLVCMKIPINIWCLVLPLLLNLSFPNKELYILFKLSLQKWWFHTVIAPGFPPNRDVTLGSATVHNTHI